MTAWQTDKEEIKMCEKKSKREEDKETQPTIDKKGRGR